MLKCDSFALVLPVPFTVPAGVMTQLKTVDFGATSVCLLSCSVVSDSLQSHGHSSVHGDSPGKNTGMVCHALLQGIFPTQGWNTSLTFPALGSGFFTTCATWEALGATSPRFQSQLAIGGPLDKSLRLCSVFSLC